MSQPRTFAASVARRTTGSELMEIDYSSPSEIATMSSFLDHFVLVLTQCRWVRENEGNVEIALPGAIDDAAQQTPKGPT
jgi:hypothetical protein